jgi:inorganic pyrophosphatase
MDKITTEKLLDELNIIIEISINDNTIKYGPDKESGTIFVDWFIQVSMFYPYNYGFIPHILSGETDLLDVLILSSYPTISRSVVNIYLLFVVLIENQSGIDKKIIAVPISKVDVFFDNIQNINYIK